MYLFINMNIAIVQVTKIYYNINYRYLYEYSVHNEVFVWREATNDIDK